MFSEIKTDPILKQQYHDHRQLYVIVKKLNFLQRAKLENRITSEKYENLKKQYTQDFNFIAKARQISLQQFCEQFSIDQNLNSYAIQILKGESQDADTVKIYKFSKQINDILEDFFVDKDEMQSGLFKQKYTELDQQYRILSDKYKNKLQDAYSTIYQDLQFLQSKNFDYRMTSAEFMNLQNRMNSFLKFLDRIIISNQLQYEKRRE